MPHYVTYPAFQELPPAAIDALNRLTVKNPSFKLPKNFPNLVGLVARIKDVPLSAAKKGELTAHFLFIFPFILIALR